MLVRHASTKLAFLAVIALTGVLSARMQADRAAEVIRSMLAALGGKSFLDVREIKASGRFFTFKGGRSAGGDAFLDYIKFPDKERTEYGTYKIKPTEIHNGDAGWSVNDKKIDPISEAEAKEFQTGFNTGFQYLARFVLSRSDLTLQLVGTEMVDYKRNDVVEFRDSGNFYRLFVDQQSHLPSKMELRRDGDSFMREEQFANWHDFQGIRTALFIIHFKDGDKTMEIRFENVSYNSGLADSLFSPPTLH